MVKNKRFIKEISLTDLMIKLNLFRGRRNEIPAASAAEPDAEEETATETDNYYPRRNYGKLVIPAIAAVLLAYHFASPYVSKTMASIRGGDKKTEEKSDQSKLDKIVCKDGSVLIFDSSKPGHYKCNDEQKPETPAKSKLEEKANETATSTVSIDKTVSSATASVYVEPNIEPSKAGNPYVQDNKIIQEIDGVPQAKEIARTAYKGVMARGSLQFSPDLKHAAWRTWFSPTNSRGNIYVADVSFDENGEIHVYQESIRAVKTYQGLTGPRVTDISWTDNGALEVVTDNIVRLGRYGIRTNHVEKTEIVPVK